MQRGRGDAGGVRDGLDFGLLAPVIADIADGAAHHLVISGGLVEFPGLGDTVGR